MKLENYYGYCLAACMLLSVFTLSAKEPNGKPNVSVEVASFQARMSDGSIRLVWEVQGEARFSHFELEKIQGQQTTSWKIKPDAVGNAYQKYFFVDHAPTKGLNSYRLKMMSKEGSEIMEAEESIEFSTPQRMKTAWDQGAKELKIENFKGEISFSIVNDAGNLVDQGTMSTDKDSLLLSTLEEGNYFVSLSDSNGMKGFPLVIE